MKNRHAVISLGDISASGESGEVDLSTFHNAWLFFKTGASAATVSVDAAPEEFGDTPSWFQYGKAISVLANSNVAIPIPMGVATDYAVPARVRVKSSQALTDVFIEGVRDIA